MNIEGALMSVCEENVKPDNRVQLSDQEEECRKRTAAAAPTASVYSDRN